MASGNESDSAQREGRRDPRGHEIGPGVARSARLAQLGAFLRSRRERLSPADAGLPVGTGRRRAAGLRREDVAALAQISAAWYTRLEQGQDVHASAAALHAIARALRLDAAERGYLFRIADVPRLWSDAAAGARDVVRACDAVPSAAAPDGTPSALRRLLDSFGVMPALVVDRYWDVVGRNAALKALLPELEPERTDPTTPPRNVVRYVLMRAATPTPSVPPREWQLLARVVVNALRASLAEVWADDPDDPHAATLVDSLLRDSPEFRVWWPEQNVWVADRPLRRVYVHPQVGPVAFDITLLDVRSAPGLTLIAYVPGDAASAARLERVPLARPAPAG